MAETTVIEPVAPPVPVQPPATEPTSPATAEHMIPKSRFDEVNAKADKAERELKKFQEAEEKKQREAMSAEQAAKADAEKYKADAETARAELLAERTKNATLAAANKAEYGDGATKQKFRNPELAYKLAKLDNPTLTAETVADALKAIAKAYPEMLEGAAAQTPPPPGPNGGKRPNSQTITQAQQDAINKKRQSYPPL